MIHGEENYLINYQKNLIKDITKNKYVPLEKNKTVLIKEMLSLSDLMCQISTIREMGLVDASLRIKKNIEIIARIIGVFLFFKEIRKFKTKKIITQKEDKKTTYIQPKMDLKPGDQVRVCSREQILQTLDQNRKLEGCFFMEEMEQYCGSKQKVLKRVNYFFDERSAKLYKAHKIILLEGVHCSGKHGNILPRCDRYCYIFWKEEWLEKIE